MSTSVAVNCRRSREVLWWVASVVCVCVSVVLFAGCGAGGPPPIPRENVSGTVNFDGKPIPFGYIAFRDEVANVLCTLEIRKGAFKGGSGDGPVAGKNSVMVTGFVEEGGMPLWSGPFKIEVEVKKGDNYGMDFEVDKNAVKPYDPKKWHENVHDRS